MTPKVTVNHPQEVLMCNQPIGTVFTNGKEQLLVKTAAGETIYIGGVNSGETVPYTNTYRAYVVTELRAIVSGVFR